jgi:hypothetical protein
MKIKKLVGLAVLPFCLWASASVAAIIVVDDFSVPQGPISDLTLNNGPIVSTIPVRTLSNNLLASIPPAQSATEVLVYTDAGINYSYLDVSNGTGEDSQVSVFWNLQPNLFPSGVVSAGYYFRIIESDNNPTQVRFSLDGQSLANFTLGGGVQNADRSFGMDMAQLARINLGGILMLQIDGATGWDMALDAFGFIFPLPPTTPVPEVASLNLLAFSLLGLGWFRNKRRIQRISYHPI